MAAVDILERLACRLDEGEEVEHVNIIYLALFMHGMLVIGALQDPKRHFLVGRSRFFSAGEIF